MTRQKTLERLVSRLTRLFSVQSPRARCGWVLAAAAISAFMGPAGAATHSQVASQDPVVSAQAEKAMQEAAQWLAQGRGAQAYESLAPHLLALGGLPSFDLLFGQAALQADHPSEAAFAFERCLSVQPANGLCRLGMARAHINLQENRSAHQELDILSQASPPEPVQKAIAQYLDVLSGMDTANTDTRLTSYLELGLGYDSNLNNATAATSMALPSFGDQIFTLSRDGRIKESGFGSARFNIRYSAPLARQWRFMTEANVAAIGNWDTSRYNSVVSDVNAGLSWRSGKHQVIGKAMAQNYRLGDQTYRNLVGLQGQYAYSVTDRAELSAFVQGSRLYYHQQQGLRDADRYTLGGTWMQGLANDRAVVYLTGYGGQETMRNRNFFYQGHQFTGVRLGGMVLLTPRLQLEAGGAIEKRRYEDKQWLFQKPQRDTFYDAYVGFNYAINRKLSLRPQYRYSKNHSNLVLYDYQRHVFSVNLRYELF